jgi:hypothetical protein
MNKEKALWLRAAAAIALWSLVGLASAQTQHYVPQSHPKYSTLYGLDWEVITDVEFANMAQGLLIEQGAAATRGAAFLFEQCFSGGMFNNLDSALGSEVRWVGGSAARHDEVSWGEGNNDPFPLDFWVKGLELALRENDTMINTVNLARLFDERGPNGTGAEHPQSIYRNGGENINHRTIGASRHNAILWAGHANAERHVNDVKIIYNSLRQAYIDSGEPYTIIVLGDSGDLGIPANPATKANLAAAFATLESSMDADADFLFFASDHGGTDTYWQFESIALAASASLVRPIELTDAELDGMRSTTEGVPGVVMRFDDLEHPGLRVYLDDFDLGDPYETRDRLGTSMLAIDRQLLGRLGPQSQLRIVNNSDFQVTLLDGLFRTGGVDNFVVPEPGTFLLLTTGLAMVTWRRSRLRRRMQFGKSNGPHFAT